MQTWVVSMFLTLVSSFTNYASKYNMLHIQDLSDHHHELDKTKNEPSQDYELSENPEDFFQHYGLPL